MSRTHHGYMTTSTQIETVDAVLIGGGIMSATLGALLTTVQPDWSIVLFERRDELATESSASWNNAGTGHSGYCELNYMPDPDDGAKAVDAARQFRLTRQWWAELAETGVLTDTFVHSTPHLDIVFGERDVDYLRRRYAALQSSPLFADMEYTEDPAVIEQWAPLLMEGRAVDGPIAATRYRDATDVDFGALTQGLAQTVADIRTGHEVTRLRRQADGLWHVRGRTHSGKFAVRARFVFVGAGGYALKLLQKAKVREVRGYGVLPAGAAFLRCDNPDVVRRHAVKVYGQAEIGAPPMSVPHLDRRFVGDTESLLFGPYATFSTRLLKHGRLTDLFTTIRWHNVLPLAAACAQNLPLLRYLLRQLMAGRRTKFAQLQRFYPNADPADWTLYQAGQRAQLVVPDGRRIGELRMGTELVVSPDTGIAGLLGASPGASTALPIMLELLRRFSWSGVEIST